MFNTTEIEEDEEVGFNDEGCIVDLLDKIHAHQDNEPDKRKKGVHKNWCKELIRMYKKYNTFVGFKAFIENL